MSNDNIGSHNNYSPANLILLNIGYAEEYSTWNYQNVCSPFTRIYYVTDGTALLTIKGKDYRLTPGHMYIVPAMTTHANTNQGVFNHYYIHLLEQLPMGENLSEKFDFPIEIDAGPEDLCLIHTLCQRNAHMGLSNANPHVYDNSRSLMETVKMSREQALHERLFSAGILLQLMSKFVERATPKYDFTDKRLRNAISFINAHFTEDFSMEEVAAVACLSTDHFLKLFRQNIGTTPRQFVIDYRLTQAKVLLVTESESISEIARQVGYSDPSYFTRLFRKHMNQTPQEYRDSFG